MRFYAVGVHVNVIEHSFFGDRTKTFQQEELYTILKKSGDPLFLFLSFDDAKMYANSLKLTNPSFFSSQREHPIFTLELSEVQVSSRGLHSKFIETAQDSGTKPIYHYNYPVTLINEQNVVRVEFNNQASHTVEFQHNQKNHFFSFS